MRRRRSTSSSSGMLTRNGRMAVSSGAVTGVAAVCAARCAGVRPTAAAMVRNTAAEVVRNDIAILPSGQANHVVQERRDKAVDQKRLVGRPGPTQDFDVCEEDTPFRSGVKAALDLSQPRLSGRAALGLCRVKTLRQETDCGF